VPECPTLYPHMLLQPSTSAPALPPFNSARTRWFYFARNAIWHMVRRLDLVGREVLVPSYHHGVEIAALVNAGAIPVFYRVGNRWDVDVGDIEAKISPRTRALYLTHYAGFPGPTAELKQLADRHGLLLVEDCALSLLSSDGPQALGSIGDIGIFCLYKTLPVPNGGALVLNGTLPFDLHELPPPPTASVFSHVASALLKNIEMRGGSAGRWARQAVRRVAHGAVRASQVERIATGTSDFNPEHVNLGISPLTLRISRGQNAERIIAARRRNYLQLLDILGPLSPPLFDALPDGVCPLFYPLPSRDKQAMLQGLWAAGIEAVDFWRDHHPACDASAFPETMQLRESIVEIPCHQDIDPETLQRMAAVVVALLQQVKRSASTPVALVA
jgi:perosamine synthetase